MQFTVVVPPGPSVQLSRQARRFPLKHSSQIGRRFRSIVGAGHWTRWVHEHHSPLARGVPVSAVGGDPMNLGNWFTLGLGDLAVIALIVWTAGGVILGILRSDLLHVIHAIGSGRLVIEKRDGAEGRVDEEAHWAGNQVNDRLDGKFR